MKNEFNFLIYKSADAGVSVNALIQNDTVWLTQKAMAELFGVKIRMISVDYQDKLYRIDDETPMKKL